MGEIITIERMGYGTESVGHLASGKTVFVNGGAPGDVLDVEVFEEKSSFAKARLLRVEESSPDRVMPECPYGLQCGGCGWSHLSYEAQLRAKRANVLSCLTRTAHFDAEVAEEMVQPCLGSKRQWGYRNKIEMGCGQDKAGRFQLGFRPEGSHELFTPDTCPVAHRGALKAPKSLRGALRFLSGNDDLGIFRVGVRTSVRTGQTEIALWTPSGPFPRAAVAKTLSSALKSTSIVRVLADPGKARKIKKVEVLDGAGCWEEQLGGLKFFTSAPSFFQVNTAQAEKLVEFAITSLGGRVTPEGKYTGLKGQLIADLYSGGGTFSVPLAKAGADVLAVEAASSSVKDLRRNAEVNNVDIEVIGGDAGRELPLLGGLDALVVDPPRAGLADGVVEDIAAAAPERVVYISCNPATWARDVQRFENEGYRLAKVQPVDLFPQTHHVEVASMFQRM